MKYATTLRPAAGGGLPPGVAWSYVEAPQDGRTYYGKDGKSVPPSRWRYGVIETDRALTPEELRHFDIAIVSP